MKNNILNFNSDFDLLLVRLDESLELDEVLAPLHGQLLVDTPQTHEPLRISCSDLPPVGAPPEAV